MIQLIEIGQTGVLPLFIARNESLISVVEATIKLYKNSGYLPPWVSYVALRTMWRSERVPSSHARAMVVLKSRISHSRDMKARESPLIWLFN